MNHPSREEWMDFLYPEELDPAQKARLNDHLQSCSACQHQLKNWRGVMTTLDRWEMSPHKETAPARQPWIRWAAAAALFLVAGVTIGAAVRPKPDLLAIRQAIEPELKASIQRDLQIQWQAQADQLAETKSRLAQLTHAVAERRAEDQENFVATVRELEARRVSDLQTLRKDLETVAALTEESLKNAQSQLVRLASLTSAP